jgi:hypothetical protein
MTQKWSDLTYQNEGTTSGPRGDGCKDGGKEDCHQETKTSDHGSQASTTTLHDPRSTLNKGGDGRTTKERANRDEGSVSAVSDGRPRKVSLIIDNVGELGHRVQCSGAVDDIDVEESQQCKCKVKSSTATKVPVVSKHFAADRTKGGNLREEVPSLITLLCAGKVGEAGIAPSRW